MDVTTIAAFVASVILQVTGHSVPLTCYASSVDYNAAAGLPANASMFQGGQAFTAWYDDHTALYVGLSYWECQDLWMVHETHTYTTLRGWAIFGLAHEMSHVMGEHDEDKADCGGAGRVSHVAYVLGMRGRANFAQLLKEGRMSWGYHPPIPAACWHRG